jgi:hypothetical protein
MVEVAAGIVAFDAMIDNVDRRPENTNLLTTTEIDIWIYDHELAFPPYILGARPPWEAGSGDWLKQRHVLFGAVRGRNPDLATLADRWSMISNDRTVQYMNSIPAEWSNKLGVGVRDRAIQRVLNVRGRIGACMDEVRRVLQ